MSTRSIILFIVLLGVFTVSLLTWVDVPDRVTITVQPSGQVFLEGRERRLEELEKIIHAYVEDDDQVEVIIMAGESIPVGDVLKIRGSVQKAGAVNIEIITDASHSLNTP